MNRMSTVVFAIDLVDNGLITKSGNEETGVQHTGGA